MFSRKWLVIAFGLASFVVLTYRKIKISCLKSRALHTAPKTTARFHNAELRECSSSDELLARSRAATGGFSRQARGDGTFQA